MHGPMYIKFVTRCNARKQPVMVCQYWKRKNLEKAGKLK